MIDRIESWKKRLTMLVSLCNERDALQDAVISRDIIIKTLRQQVKGLEDVEKFLITTSHRWQDDLVRLNAELAALKHTKEPE